MSHTVCAFIQLFICKLNIIGNDSRLVRMLCGLSFKELITGGIRYLDFCCVEGINELCCSSRHNRNIPEFILFHKLRCGLFHAGNKTAHKGLGITIRTVIAGKQNLALPYCDINIKGSFGITELQGDHFRIISADA